MVMMHEMKEVTRSSFPVFEGRALFMNSKGVITITIMPIYTGQLTKDLLEKLGWEKIASSSIFFPTLLLLIITCLRDDWIIWIYVRAGRPAFARPYVGVHKSTSLMSSSLLLQQCPACLVRLTWIVFVEDTRCSPEDLPEAMNDREKWRERVREIRATSTTWWWWWIIWMIVGWHQEKFDSEFVSHFASKPKEF